MVPVESAEIRQFLVNDLIVRKILIIYWSVDRLPAYEEDPAPYSQWLLTEDYINIEK